MLEHVTIETFRPHVGTTFQIHVPNYGLMPVVLTEVSEAPTDNDSRRTRVPFSLIFRPPEGLQILQATYLVDGAAGTLEIFLVPIVPDREGARIQAVFA